MTTGFCWGFRAKIFFVFCWTRVRARDLRRAPPHFKLICPQSLYQPSKDAAVLVGGEGVILSGETGGDGLEDLLVGGAGAASGAGFDEGPLALDVAGEVGGDQAGTEGGGYL